MIPIDPAAAAWIKAVVLPARYLASRSDPALCPCQYGVCSACGTGHHHQCAVVAWGGAPRAVCDTHIVDSRGYVATAPGVRTSEVWRTGRPCRWICACGCTPVGAEPPPAGPHEPIQLDLFAIAAA